MFIRNQKFKDEETLLEILFDFELGTSTDVIISKRESIEEDLKENKAFHEYIATLTDEEERLEVETEERNIRLAESLMEDFESFQVEKNKLYGVKGSDRTLLSEME